MDEERVEEAIRQANQLREEDEAAEQAAADVENQLANEYQVLNPPQSQEELDVFEQIGLERPAQQDQEGEGEGNRWCEVFQVPNALPEADYRSNIARLNSGQRKIFLECMRRIKEGEAFHFFISGGAGVGKSFLIDTLYQAAERHYRKLPGNDGSTIKVLLCAPTGKAAFNIRGMTLHSAFSLPLTQENGELLPLSANTLNKLRSKLRDIKLLVVDEISMVGRKMLKKLDARMRQIFNSDQPFGGIAVIVVGDFNQLRPVGDGYVLAFAANHFRTNTFFSFQMGLPS